MENKLQELTDKIYQEGISKANEEAEKIISEANSESKRILEEAQKKADEIISKAKDQADETIKNGNSELKISFQHAVNTLKQDMEKMISKGIIKEKVSESFDDDDFVADLIRTIYENWKPESGKGSIDLLIPKDKAVAIEKSLKSAMAKELKSGIVIKPVGEMKKGFEVKVSDGGFKISATGSDIENYLKEFIRPKLSKLLFEEK